MVPSEYHIGRRVAELRRAAGLNQADLAERLGLSRQQVHKYEAGVNRIALSRAIEIADLLRVPVDAFRR